MNKRYALQAAFAAVILTGCVLRPTVISAQEPAIVCQPPVSTTSMKGPVRSALYNQKSAFQELIADIISLHGKDRCPRRLDRYQRKGQILFEQSMLGLNTIPQYLQFCSGASCIQQSFAPLAAAVLDPSQRLMELHAEVAQRYHKLLGAGVVFETERAQIQHNMVHEAFDYFPPFVTVCG